jgi:hypothetical protein
MEPIRFLWNTLKSHASYVFFSGDVDVQERLATDINGLVFALARMTIPDSIAAAVCILCCFGQAKTREAKSTRKQQFHFIQSRKTEKKVNNLIHSNVTNGRKFR